MRKIEFQILCELAGSEKSFWDLLDKNHHLLTDFVKALNRLQERGLLTVEDGRLRLTEKGLKALPEAYSGFESDVCRVCRGKRIVFGGRFNQVLEEYRRIVRDRPKPKVDYFQGYMNERDVVARVALIHHYGDLAEKEFILVGDDDLLSVALALTGLPKRVVVLDVDERLGRYLESVNRRYGFSIEFRRYNVSDPLPEDLIGCFDVFSSEPLETWSGLKAFLSRGVSCLRRNGVGYFGLTTAEASLRKWIKVERLLAEMNLVVTDIIRDFSAYPMDYGTVDYEKFTVKLNFKTGENPGVDWYKSSLFRFEALGRPKPAVKPERKIKIEYLDPEEDITYPLLYR